MTEGRVIAVVGPSGVGKDSVMRGVATAEPGLHLVQRVITRPPDQDGEAHTPATEAEFRQQAQDGAFCLHWTAHGLSYGIPTEVQTRARQGDAFLVNLSRAVLPQAAAAFPNFMVLNLTATPETLARRLRSRGRETPTDIAARLSRDGAHLPRSLATVTLANDGTLGDTVATVIAALRRPAISP